MQQYATIQLNNLETDKQATLSIFDALGQEVEQLQSTTGLFRLENKNWSTGMYIYQIQIDQELIGTGKNYSEVIFDFQIKKAPSSNLENGVFFLFKNLKIA